METLTASWLSENGKAECQRVHRGHREQEKPLQKDKAQGGQPVVARRLGMRGVIEPAESPRAERVAEGRETLQMNSSGYGELRFEIYFMPLWPLRSLWQEGFLFFL